MPRLHTELPPMPPMPPHLNDVMQHHHHHQHHNNIPADTPPASTYSPSPRSRGSKDDCSFTTSMFDSIPFLPDDEVSAASGGGAAVDDPYAPLAIHEGVPLSKHLEKTNAAAAAAAAAAHDAHHHEDHQHREHHHHQQRNNKQHHQQQQQRSSRGGGVVDRVMCDRSEGSREGDRTPSLSGSSSFSSGESIGHSYDSSSYDHIYRTTSNNHASHAASPSRVESAITTTSSASLSSCVSPSSSPPMKNDNSDVMYDVDSDEFNQQRFKPFHEEKWSLRYKELLDFHKEHGHAAVPHTYHPNPQLARWVKRQRRQYKLRRDTRSSTMTRERLELLDAVGFIWDSHDVNWREKLDSLQRFRKQHGHCNVPSNYKEKKLATWVKCQRRQYKLYWDGKPSAMSPERIVQLEKMGFEWEIRSAAAKLAAAQQQTTTHHHPEDELGLLYEHDGDDFPEL